MGISSNSQIASRLRYVAADELGGMSLQKRLAKELELENTSWRGVLRGIAGLIDRPTTKRDDVGGIYWRCHQCGAFNRKDAVTDCSSVIQSRYCANCGAVVVSDDD